MMPPDSLRQKMLFRTEWKSIGVQAADPVGLGKAMNEAFATLAEEGFNISQVLPLPDALAVGVGMLVVAQKLSSPVSDPTPEGAVVPGTNGTQTVEVTYSAIVAGAVERETCPSLAAAVRHAAADLDESAGAGKRHPLGIHVTSVTSYSAGDLHVLREKFK